MTSLETKFPFDFLGLSFKGFGAWTLTGTWPRACHKLLFGLNIKHRYKKIQIHLWLNFYFEKIKYLSRTINCLKRFLYHCIIICINRRCIKKYKMNQSLGDKSIFSQTLNISVSCFFCGNTMAFSTYFWILLIPFKNGF